MKELLYTVHIHKIRAINPGLNQCCKRFLVGLYLGAYTAVSEGGRAYHKLM